MDLSSEIKKQASLIGFIDCRFTPVTALIEEKKYLDQWIEKGYHGTMGYMAKNQELRVNPQAWIANGKTVISLNYNYFHNKLQRDNTYKVSRYAYGRDYHKVLKKKLKKLISFIEMKVGSLNYRCFVDSAPHLEKAWAQRSGLGWMGKHTNIINKKVGSFFFITEIICDISLTYDQPVSDACGTCTRCIDACPTGAIEEPYTLNAKKCISYLTIEHKGNIDSCYKDKMDDWIFGCDICQDVCPWNRFSVEHKDADFLPQKTRWLDYQKEDWKDLSESEFQEQFAGSPLKRAGWEGIKRNINFIQDT